MENGEWVIYCTEDRGRTNLPVWEMNGLWSGVA